jgi:hypothetical protein
VHEQQSAARSPSPIVATTDKAEAADVAATGAGDLTIEQEAPLTTSNDSEGDVDMPLNDMAIVVPDQHKAADTITRAYRAFVGRRHSNKVSAQINVSRYKADHRFTEISSIRPLLSTKMQPCPHCGSVSLCP